MNAKLVEKIEKYKAMTAEELAEKFNCKPEEICMGDYIAKNTSHKKCPYKVILGKADFEGSDVEDLGKLEIVFGKMISKPQKTNPRTKDLPTYLGLNLKKSKIKRTKNVKKVYGLVYLNRDITTLENMEFLGSSLVVSNSNLSSFGNLQVIDGTLTLEDDAIPCKITSLEKIRKIRKLVVNSKSLEDYGDLEEVKELLTNSKCSKKFVQKFHNNFIHTDKRFVNKNIIKVDY